MRRCSADGLPRDGVAGGSHVHGVAVSVGVDRLLQVGGRHGTLGARRDGGQQGRQCQRGEHRRAHLPAQARQDGAARLLDLGPIQSASWVRRSRRAHSAAWPQPSRASSSVRRSVHKRGIQVDSGSTLSRHPNVAAIPAVRSRPILLKNSKSRLRKISVGY